MGNRFIARVKGERYSTSYHTDESAKAFDYLARRMRTSTRPLLCTIEMYLNGMTGVECPYTLLRMRTSGPTV